MTKKSNGEGSVQKYYQNGVFKGWRGRLSVGYDEKGKLIRKPFYGKTKKEVLDRMAAYKYKHNTGQLPLGGEKTIAQWFHAWLFDFRAHNLKPSTFERYEGVYRKYIEGSPVGKVKLVDLQPELLQDYLNSLLAAGKSVIVVRTVNQFLGTCLKEALKRKLIMINPCSHVALPKLEDGEEIIIALTQEEQATFIKAVQGHKYEAAMLLTLSTGLRLGEMLALKWADIDFTDNTLHVSRSVKRVTIIAKDGGREGRLIEQPPKTKSSVRTMPIPVNIVTRLKQHRKKQLEIKLKNHEFYNDMDYVFCDRFGNLPDVKKIPRNFQSVLKKSGLRVVKFHALRHTYCTRLFEAGVEIKTVQVLMGHSRIETTMNIYTHVMPEQKDLAAEKINALFKL